MNQGTAGRAMNVVGPGASTEPAPQHGKHQRVKARSLVTRTHMGEELTQVLPLSVFEHGELRALREAASALHGLVREGAQIVRGNRTQAIANAVLGETTAEEKKAS